MGTPSKTNHLQTYVLALIAIITTVFILVIAKEFFIPIALGLLFAFFLYPTAERMEAWGMPRLLVNFILVLAALVLVLGTIFLLSLLLSNFLDNIPAIKQNLIDRIDTMSSFLQLHTGIEIGDTGILATSENALFSFNSESIQKFFSATSNTIFIFGLTLVYVFLFLFYRNKFRTFIFKLVPKNKHGKINRMLEEISHVTPRYLTGLIIVVSILAVLNSLGFLIIGVKYALFFGVLAALLNLIPYLGTIIGYLIVFLFALVTQSASVALGVIVLFIIIQFTENNILTPSITGGRVHINPLITIMALIAAGAMWGFVGMFIILPFLSMFKIIAEHITSLRPFAFFIGTEGTEKHALTLSSVRGFVRKYF